MMSTGRAHVHALASLSIVCVLTTLTTAGTLTISNRNGSNYSSIPGSIILEPHAEVEQSKYQNGTQNNSSEYNNMKQNISMNAKQDKIQPVEFNKSEIPTHDKLKSSNETLTSKLSQNESHLYEESPSVTNENQNSETGSEDTLVRKYFKQYNFTGNTVAESVTTNSFKNAQTLVENKTLSTHDDSSSVSQENSKHLSTDVFKQRESRQLSPGQYASYFIGPKLCGEIESPRKTVHPKDTEIGKVEIKGRSLRNSNIVESRHLLPNQGHGRQRDEIYTKYKPVQSLKYSYNRRSYDAYPYNRSPQLLAQDRYHPTTYEEAVEGEGEVREVPLSSDPQTSFDSVQSGSDQNYVQDSYVQAAFNQYSLPQGSENSIRPDNVPVDSYPEPQIAAYSYTPPAPSGGYDYHAPPPPPTDGYYYPPPSNQYLPDPPAPEETRQTTDYTYYYLGPKLWYIPLFFSVYFVLYVAALIIKAIAKHKIIFPQQMFNAATSVLTQARSENVNQVLSTVATAISEATKKYL